MKGNLIKVITLIILIILVIITFDLTNKNQETGLINKNEGNKTSSNISIKDDKKEENETIIDDKENEKQDNNEIVEEESNIIKQYKLFNKYIVTSENTEYKEVDYKYFIIRSYSELEKYINEYLIEYSKEDSKYKTYNEELKDEILKEFDKDFFAENSVILLSDVNSRKQINGNISEIAKGDEGLIDLKIKKEDNENLANSITYIIPIEKGIKQVKAKHIN